MYHYVCIHNEKIQAWSTCSCSFCPLVMKPVIAWVPFCAPAARTCFRDFKCWRTSFLPPCPILKSTRHALQKAWLLSRWLFDIESYSLVHSDLKVHIYLTQLGGVHPLLPFLYDHLRSLLRHVFFLALRSWEVTIDVIWLATACAVVFAANAFDWLTLALPLMLAFDTWSGNFRTFDTHFDLIINKISLDIVKYGS